MILLVGQVARDAVGREGFQELDYAAVFGSMAKWVAQIDDAARVPELVARAFAVATSGRPGPVVLALPEDMLTRRRRRPRRARRTGRSPPTPPGDAAMARLTELLEGAERPLAIVGEGGWTSRTGLDVAAFCEASASPSPLFRCQDYIDNRSPAYAARGSASTRRSRARIREPTCCWRSAARLSEITTDAYTLLSPPAPAQRARPRASRPGPAGSVYQPELGIACDLEAFSAAAARSRRDGPRATGCSRRPTPSTSATCTRSPSSPARCRCPPSWRRCASGCPRRDPDERRGQLLDLGAPLLRVPPPRDPARAPQRLDGLRRPRRRRGEGRRTRSGRGLHRGRRRLPHDGQELATAVQEDLPIVVLVVNNGMYGTIRMHQERRYPGRVFATDLRNPDFAAYAQAFGAHGAVVERTEDVGPALDEALTCGRPALVELRVDPQAITPRGPWTRSATRRRDDERDGDRRRRRVPRRGGGGRAGAHRGAARAAGGHHALRRRGAGARTNGVRGRLAGVPLLVKDLIDTAGIRTTYASSLYAEHVPERTASSVAALEAEGAIVVARRTPTSSRGARAARTPSTATRSTRRRPTASPEARAAATRWRSPPGWCR